jgi:hypothetical protein
VWRFFTSSKCDMALRMSDDLWLVVSRSTN